MKRKFLRLFLGLLSVAMVLCTITACSCKKDDQPISAVKLDKTAATMDLYETLTLEATLENLTGDIVWSTSDQTKATVKDGVVTSLAEGEVTIGASVGEVSANCIITIQSSGEIPALTLNQENIVLKTGGNFTIVPTLKYKGNEVAATFAFSSENSAVANISSNGQITVGECGNTRITVTASYLGFETTKMVSVKVTPNIVVDLDALKITLGTCAVGEYTTQKVVAATVTKDGVAVDSPVIDWSTSDNKVATVENGTITAVGVGESTITATFVFDNESFKSVVKVAVEKPVLNGTLTNNVLDIDADEADKVSLSLEGLNSYAVAKDLIKITNKGADNSKLSFVAGTDSVELYKNSLKAGKYNFELEFAKIIYNVNVKVTADVIDVASFSSKDDADRVGVYMDLTLEKSYTEERAYGSEKGSLKFTVKQESCPNYINIFNPLNSDVSDYGYLIWRIYNNTQKTLKIGTTWIGDTDCAPGQWTEIIIWTSQFGESGSVVDYPAGNKLLTTDITNFVIRLLNDGKDGGESLSVGDTFYVSAIQGVKDEKSAAENVVAEFTEDLDLKRVVSGEYQLGINTDKAYIYGEETGSLKVKNAGESATGDSAITLNNAVHTDMSAYDYVEFYVYNATESDVTVGTWWCADTACKKGEWTAVRITKNLSSSLYGCSFENMNGFKFRIYSGLPADGVIYISALKGVKVEGNIGVDFNDSTDLSRVSVASGCELSINTDETYVYGEETGSLKLKNVSGAALSNDYAVQIKDAYKLNLSAYDYIVFYVYNATDSIIRVGTLWCADTACNPGVWTEIKITKDMSISGFSFENINGMYIRLIDYGQETSYKLPADGVIYISALTGGYNT